MRQHTYIIYRKGNSNTANRLGPVGTVKAPDREAAASFAASRFGLYAGQCFEAKPLSKAGIRAAAEAALGNQMLLASVRENIDRLLEQIDDHDHSYLTIQYLGEELDQQRAWLKELTEEYGS